MIKLQDGGDEMTTGDTAERLEAGLGADPGGRRWWRTPLLLVVTALITAVTVALLIGRWGAPGDASPEAGFARDMAIHHAQAVEMSFIVRGKTTDEALRTLAYDIITTQSTQRGVFMGWLQQWGLSQASSRPPMAWMSGHGHGGGATASPRPATGGLMAGMATPEEMERLRAATGREAEILFLQLMIRHHVGGVEMAEGVLRLSKREEVRDMAQHIVDSQNAEVTLMKRMLADRGAEPLP
ncbi:DUF305 domain-containing protein [Thermobispora bispora]|uniref:DUF305 domain-containing protein n=1 Tax=Thermobispora bispora (strain ATCC 19993 / DSM 43833 / CBS 139.67 / JCM 10125 / KCTC 9307 / NBRC 14880 / R51) TaxID=469371 RepID=D6Y8Q9_THEBD|nr:DUF305 domain-containing protein [Thermobispora bispora]ADG87956.1 protein of unknown function DUF305 [Thermobispora bispora DSM 43833]